MNLPIVSFDRQRSYPPRVTKFTRRFWAALHERRFETTSCEGCARPSFPPKPFCPHCWSRNIRWISLSGRGRLYSQTVIHAAPAAFRAETPYRVGIVDLHEGLRIATRIVGDPSPQIDGPVEIVVLNYLDGPLFAARGVA
jgi:uncharacterized OB-fold protein